MARLIRAGWLAGVVAAAWLAGAELALAGSTYYVGPSGVDDLAAGRGQSLENPWRTIGFAVQQVPDNGSTVEVLDGTYLNPEVSLSRAFLTSLTLRSRTPYRAILTNTGGKPVLRAFGGANYTIEGFVIGPTSSVLAVQLGAASHHFTFRNNIFRDSYNNDLLKVNDRATDILIEGNVFLNHGGDDEDIDLNAVKDIAVQDNIFFSDYAGSGRALPGARSNVVAKNSPCQWDASFCNNWTHRIAVRRNVFLNWEGDASANFVRIGEDATPAFEAQDVTIENNLMLGNSPTVLEAPIGIEAARNVTVRANTIVGNLPCRGYTVALRASAYRTEQVSLTNNLWSDPTGTMGPFSLGTDSGVSFVTFQRNLYWNGGQPIPASAQGGLELGDDPRAVVADPALPLPAGIVLPRFDPATGAFLSGQTTIRGEFERLVALYGQPAEGSAALDAGDPLTAPTDDILGRVRATLSLTPDLGAYERSASPDTAPPVIQGLDASGVTETAALISWTTNEAATGQVEYGLDAAYGLFSAPANTLTMNHAISLAGLLPSTAYHYLVHSQDAAGNGSASPDQTFTTAAAQLVAFQEVNGQLVLEGERADEKIGRGGKNWTPETSKSGYSGSGYVRALANTGTQINTGYTTTSPELVFRVRVTKTGKYYVWIRGLADSGSDDSLHAGLDGAGPSTADRITGFTTSWAWKRATMDASAPATLTISSPGVHTIHLWMREDGLRVDKILLRTNSSSTAPSGKGPAESPRS